MKKWLIGLAVALLVIVLAKNLLLTAGVTKIVHAVTGLDLKIGGIDVGLINTRLGIKNLKIMNPPGFHDPVLLEMPEIYVDYDLPGFFKGKAHLEEVRLSLKELTVVRNERGEVNVNSLNVVKASKGQTTPKEQEQAKKAAPNLEIDLLHLKIGKVVFKDYSRGGEPQVREFAINSDEQFEHIRNPYMLAGLIMSRALMRTTIANIANLDLGALQSQLGTILQQPVGVFNDTVIGATKSLGEATKSLESIGKGTAGSADKAVKETTDAFKKLLGQ